MTSQAIPFRRTSSCSGRGGTPTTPAPPPATPAAPSAAQPQPQPQGQGSRLGPDSWEDTGVPRIVCVGHSLGGTSLLLYSLLCGALGVSHGVERLVCLSPAGFHKEMPALIRMVTNAAAFVLKPAGYVHTCTHTLPRHPPALATPPHSSHPSSHQSSHQSCHPPDSGPQGLLLTAPVVALVLRNGPFPMVANKLQQHFARLLQGTNLPSPCQQPHSSTLTIPHPPQSAPSHPGLHTSTFSLTLTHVV